jgi:hypothetical protein
MTDAQRELVFEALMYGVPREAACYPTLTEIAAKDLDQLEPIIDGFIRDAAGSTARPPEPMRPGPPAAVARTESPQGSAHRPQPSGDVGHMGAGREEAITCSD